MALLDELKDIMAQYEQPCGCSQNQRFKDCVCHNSDVNRAQSNYALYKLLPSIIEALEANRGDDDREKTFEASMRDLYENIGFHHNRPFGIISANGVHYQTNSDNPLFDILERLDIEYLGTVESEV